MLVILYLFNGGGAAFYRWKRESRVRRSRRNSRAAKYGRRSCGCRRRIRRMPYGGGTVNVGVREEMESHIDLIHEGFGEIVHLAHTRGGGARRSDHSGSLGELNTDQGRCWRYDPFGRGGVIIKEANVASELRGLDVPNYPFVNIDDLGGDDVVSGKDGMRIGEEPTSNVGNNPQVFSMQVLIPILRDHNGAEVWSLRGCPHGVTKPRAVMAEEGTVAGEEQIRSVGNNPQIRIMNEINARLVQHLATNNPPPTIASIPDNADRSRHSHRSSEQALQNRHSVAGQGHSTRSRQHQSASLHSRRGKSLGVLDIRSLSRTQDTVGEETKRRGRSPHRNDQVHKHRNKSITQKFKDLDAQIVAINIGVNVLVTVNALIR
ncbi:hypothetical protein Acr_00g0027760 [Actinidia rufa]|uniref:RING/U-box superfamily protein n=1 Tax=Actinidia rufa TaxID=165716 RepID=A0A7J0DE24_9ERIC|nr:hypothetical protein Acr_00g0027760 [Actinidia rufa]